MTLCLNGTTATAMPAQVVRQLESYAEQARERREAAKRAPTDDTRLLEWPNSGKRCHANVQRIRACRGTHGLSDGQERQAGVGSRRSAIRS